MSSTTTPGRLEPAHHTIVDLCISCLRDAREAERWVERDQGNGSGEGILKQVESAGAVLVHRAGRYTTLRSVEKSTK